MQIQSISNAQSFQGHGARRLSDVMNKLHKEMTRNYSPTNLDSIQLSSTMKDGTDVTAMACFVGGKYQYIIFPQEFVPYKTQFCNKLFERYNDVVTKGKSKGLPRR